MSKSTLILLQIIFAANAVLCKSVVSSKEFIYIGSFKSEIAARGDGNFDENDYYVSVNDATWSSAEADCKTKFGGSSSLLSIESVEEWDFLKLNLESIGGTTYWTSGMYDPSTSTWRWSTHNQPLPPFAPWDSGYPSNPNAILRVLLFYTNRFSASWRTIANTRTERYICEVQKTTVPVPCYRTNDLVIVLDSSGSIGTEHFEEAKVFVEKLSRAFTAYSSNRFAFLIYNSTAKTIIDIQNTLSPTAISSTILSTPYYGGGTATHLGINLAYSQFNSSPRAAPLNMVVLTDGQSDSPNSTITAANSVLNMGVRSFSVGITPSIDRDELLAIAGEHSRVYYSTNFDELIYLLAPLSLDICSNT